MARLLFLPLLVLAVLAQATYLEQQDWLEITPDFTVILLLCWSAMRGSIEGMAWAFGVGIALDVIALDALGANPLALLPVVLLGSLASGGGMRSRLLMPILMVLLATVLHGVVLLLLRSGEETSLSIAAVVRLTMTQGFLNILLLPVIYFVVSLFGRVPEQRYA